MCTEVVSGLKEDDTLFIAIYCLDKEDDWKDEAVWVKSNPNLGVTVQTKYLKTQVRKAINTPSDEVGIKTKNLNIWCDAEKTWIKDDYILSASANVNLEEYNGLDCYRSGLVIYIRLNFILCYDTINRKDGLENILLSPGGGINRKAIQRTVWRMGTTGSFMYNSGKCGGL